MAEVRLALIPPVSLLKDTFKTDMQLALPHMLIGNSDYRKVYKKHFKDPNQYVILDNGAAEGNMIDDEDLVSLTWKYTPDELAIPDTLADSAKTIQQAERFFAHHEDAINEWQSTTLGFVAQGKSVSECLTTVSIMEASWWSNYVNVLYLPRLIIKETGNPMSRIELAVRLNDNYGDRFEYHLFGSAPLWPAEISAATKVPSIRSMDTSVPYSLAYARKDLIWGTMEGDEVNRPVGYFDKDAEKFDRLRVSGNVASFIEMSGGYDAQAS